MTKSIIVTTVIIFIVVVTVSGQRQKRDLSEYQKHSDITIEFSAIDLEHQLADALWEAWHSRRKFTMDTTFLSREGQLTRTTYFVEPDEKLGWVIRWDFIRGCWHRDRARCPAGGERVTATYDQVKRIEPDPSSTNRPYFTLTLRNSRSKKVFRL